jgi:hypothetical protein
MRKFEKITLENEKNYEIHMNLDDKPVIIQREPTVVRIMIEDKDGKKNVIRLDVREDTFHVSQKGRFIFGNKKLNP